MERIMKRLALPLIALLILTSAGCSGEKTSTIAPSTDQSAATASASAAQAYTGEIMDSSCAMMGGHDSMMKQAGVTCDWRGWDSYDELHQAEVVAYIECRIRRTRRGVRMLRNVWGTVTCLLSVVALAAAALGQTPPPSKAASLSTAPAEELMRVYGQLRSLQGR